MFCVHRNFGCHWDCVHCLSGSVKHEGVVVINFAGLEKIVTKLIMLNNVRLKELRSSRGSPLTKCEYAEHDDRAKEGDWLEALQKNLVLWEEVSNAKEAISGDMDARYDRYAMTASATLEKIRKFGAGFIHDEAYLKEVRDAALNHQKQISDEDKDFLKSCGIKAEKREIW